jgi:sugar phosphate isomerase/epimerase
MDVAIRDMLLDPVSLDELAKKVKALGLEKIELWMEREMTTGWKEALSGEQKQKEFAKRVKMAGLKICAGIVSTHLANENAEPEIAYAVNAARLLSVMGVKIMRIDVAANEPDKKELQWQEYLQRSVKTVKKCVELTKDIKTEFAVENHGLISNRAEFLKELLDRVGSQRMGLCLDTGNFYWYGYPLSKTYEIMEELAQHVKHTHIKNINYPFKISEEQRKTGYEYEKYVSPLKEGNIDLARVVKILKGKNFNGSLCIEDESLGKFPENKRIEVLKEDADFLKSLV